MKKHNFEHVFVKASRLNIPNEKIYSAGELQELRRADGAKRFKRKALGLCGKESIKSLDEMALLLCQTGITGSFDEGRNLTPYLIGVELSLDLKSNYLGIAHSRGENGQECYKVHVYSRD